MATRPEKFKAIYTGGVQPSAPVPLCRASNAHLRCGRSHLCVVPVGVSAQTCEERGAVAEPAREGMGRSMEMDPDFDGEPAGSRATSMASLYAGLDDEKRHQLAKQHGYAHHEITELLLAFNVLDVDGSGAVSATELMEVIGCDPLTDHP